MTAIFADWIGRVWEVGFPFEVSRSRGDESDMRGGGAADLHRVIPTTFKKELGTSWVIVPAAPNRNGPQPDRPRNR